MNMNREKCLYFTLALLVSTQVQAQTGNTSYGANALLFSSGSYNSAFGTNALRNNTFGNNNTSSGADSMYWNTGGSSNTAFGAAALAQNTMGNNSTAVGFYALQTNTTGGNNTAIGYYALYTNTTGYSNTAAGYNSLGSNITGHSNVASGVNSLRLNNSGYRNTASGYGSLFANSTGYDNTASGEFSLYGNTTGYNNTASGRASLRYNTTGTNNTAMGTYALYENTTGVYNLALGSSALYKNTIGTRNIAMGGNALYLNTTGSNNVGVGEYAGYANATGSNNVFVGRGAGLFETGSNKLYITGNTIRPLLYGVFSETASANKLGIGQNTVPAADAIAVWNGARLTTGGIWTNASSRELKDNIKSLSIEDANKALAGLSPVRYVYKNSPDEEYVGFIAEDVPELVATNDHKSLSPMDIVAVLAMVTKDQKAKVAEAISEKDAEIAALRGALAKQEMVNQKQEVSMLHMELALAELQRHQVEEVRVSSSN